MTRVKPTEENSAVMRPVGSPGREAAISEAKSLISGDKDESDEDLAWKCDSVAS